jgi:hypothetical protein
METTYKGCDININLLSVKDGKIGYEYTIITYEKNQPTDHPFSGEMTYIGEKESLAYLLSKVQEWIDDHG